MRKFNKNDYRVAALKIKPEIKELAKCTHPVYDKETGKCPVCGAIVSRIYVDTPKVIPELIEHLDCMKMIIYSCTNRKVQKAAQKYFDMIPLLENLPALLDICKEELHDANFEEIEAMNISRSSMPEYIGKNIDDDYFFDDYDPDTFDNDKQ